MAAYPSAQPSARQLSLVKRQADSSEESSESQGDSSEENGRKKRQADSSEESSESQGESISVALAKDEETLN